MHKLSRAAPYIAYAVATAGMAVLLLLGSSPGAIIARSYQAYNGCPVPGSPEYIYQDVNLPFSVPLSPVTAVEARAKKDGYILFGYPRCPYCRNLLPVLAAVAESEGVRMDYCQIDLYRDIYAYSVDAAAPVQTRTAGEGYAELLTWLDDYLAEYTVTDQNKNSIDVGEKRIGAPTIIKVVEGKPVSKWQLSDAAIFAAGYPKNKYAAWDDATQQGVAASLRDYLAVG